MANQFNIDYETFKAVCPSGTQPDDALFRSLSDAVAAASRTVMELAGPAFSEITSVLSDGSGEADPYRTAYMSAVRYICNRAYADTVPHLDLVLTSTGFGVVSNANVAPASRDRVDRLLGRLEAAASDAMDGLILSLRYFDSWRETCQADECISSLFWLARHLRRIGLHGATRADLDRVRPQISQAEAELAALISPEMLSAVIDSQRYPSPPGRLMADLQRMCRNYVGAAVDGKPDRRVLGRSILRFLCANIGDFPEFAASGEYAAITSEKYENQADDPCFFFA